MILLLFACADDEPAVPGPGEHLWLDDEGRHVMHRGMNVNNTAKGSEDNLPGLEDHEIDLLVIHGVTLVRYLVFWHALEPVAGEYDEAYVQRVADDIGRFTDRGLSVLVDMHQDVYGEGFGHAGLPAWTCDQALYDSYVPPTGSWYLAYARVEVQECFDRFWASEELQQANADAWAELSVVLAEDPGVVAFEVMNEPFWGTIEVEQFEGEVLPAFYATVADALPADRPVVVEPSVSANVLKETSLALPDGDWILGPHYYPLYAEEGLGFDGDFDEEEADLRWWATEAEERDIPLLIGEFGIFSDFGNEADYVRSLVDVIAEEGGSTAYWSYDRNDSWAPLTSEGEAGAGLEGYDRPWLHRTPGPFVVDTLGWRITGTSVQADIEVVVPGTCEPDGDWDPIRRVLSIPAPAPGEELVVLVDGCSP